MAKTENVTETTETANETTETTRRRGRPREPRAIERDQRVYDALSDGAKLTRNEIVAKLGAPDEGGKIYLSIHRLRGLGLVEKTTGDGRDVHWQQVPGGDRDRIRESASTVTG